jgi:hypothetical protein
VYELLGRALKLLQLFIFIKESSWDKWGLFSCYQLAYVIVSVFASQLELHDKSSFRLEALYNHGLDIECEGWGREERVFE